MQRQRNNSRGQRRARRRRIPVSGAARLVPPEFVSTFALGHKFRFSAASVFTALPITRAMLLNLYTMATTTTAQNRVITGIKLNRVTMWANPPALGSNDVSVVAEWLGLNSPSTIHSDTSMGVRPAVVRTRPPVDASNRWWSISGNNEAENLIKLSGPIGTIIDVDCSVRFADDEAAVAGENGTGAAATVGKVYWNYLDGFASKMLAPVGGVTILP